ncbi:hypothetical protein CHLRE_16g691100v5 [Chlamydomonas reinhardtii]|uniref:Uncharacterized protein n=1 Tax=Chlamydomonas reinhardtii TaxID=3055 RepID=A0A2K3CSJ4_CHLRE|nr:uncharacterized protein CHLRE_16g691100v5 [Chlamydomonas reinhardtii]PNW71264.1 hypothetical protein CHLRE_16g691100v5 [Chlamydomonas reinhardtii]
MTGGHGKTPQPEPKESSTVEGVPSRSNYGAEHTAAMPREEGVDVPRRVVPMAARDERHMRQDILQRERANQQARQHHQQALQAAAPGNSLEEMAAGDPGRKSPGRRQAETTPPDFVNDKFKEVAYRDAPEARLFEDENKL